MHDTEIRVMRIFNTYGQRMLPDDGRVVTNFILQALPGESLKLYGNDSQTRSFCFGDDLVERMNRERAEHLRERINPDLEPIEKPLPADDRLQRQTLIDLARAELGWEPTIPSFREVVS